MIERGQVEVRQDGKRRVIVKLARKGIYSAPAGAWLVDDHLDYETDGEAPADAVYVAEKGADGKVVEKVNKVPPGQWRKDRSGWTRPGKP